MSEAKKVPEPSIKKSRGNDGTALQLAPLVIGVDESDLDYVDE